MYDPLHRPSNDVDSALAGHLISGSPCGLFIELGSHTSPSGDAPIQLCESSIWNPVLVTVASL